MSGFSTTPNFGLKKPSTGADDGLWGTHWNQNADTLDATLKAHGDAISGLGTGSVTSWNTRVGAVVLTNADVTAVLPPSSTTPAMDGSAAVGTGTTWARSDHIHPTDTSRYAASNPSGYQTAAQVQSAVAPAFNGTGRNLIHNPLFNVAQRGPGAFSTSGTYTLDRWFLAFNLDTTFVQQGQFNDAQRATIGDEAADNFLAMNVTGNAGAASFSLVSQSIENVRRLAGKTVTVSFWASAAAGAPKLGIGMRQYFGTGGSPSALVDLNGQSVTLTTGTPTRYSVTFSLPSIAAKTLGTNKDDLTRLSFWPSSGTTNAASAGNPGVQTCTVALWGVQLEVGSVATPLEKPDPRYDLSNCQRFVCILSLGMQPGSASVAGYQHPFPVTMRATPTATNLAPGTVSNATFGGEGAGDNKAAFFQLNALTAAGFILNRLTLYSADL